AWHHGEESPAWPMNNYKKAAARELITRCWEKKWAEGLVQHPAYTQPQRWRVTRGLKTLCLGMKRGLDVGGASRHTHFSFSWFLALNVIFIGMKKELMFIPFG
ncbi:hypothetical protein VIGAN_03149200, partial [Vigna angularis var. angularis]